MHECVKLDTHLGGRNMSLLIENESNVVSLAY